MSDRIRNLEEALETLQGQYSAEPHPLLGPQFLGVKSTMGLYGGTQVGAESPDHDHDKKHVNMDVDTPDRGSSEETQKGTIVVPVSLPAARVDPISHLFQHKIPYESTDSMFAEVLRLSQCYPLPENVSPEPNIKLREYIRGMLPDRAEAEYLWQQALVNALWQ